MADTYYGKTAHPTCTPEVGHQCAQPSGRGCVEPGCGRAAGTWWGPNWCPDHDAERIDNVSAGLVALSGQPTTR